jgi:hypothetical protein
MFKENIGTKDFNKFSSRMLKKTIFHKQKIKKLNTDINIIVQDMA